MDITKFKPILMVIGVVSLAAMVVGYFMQPHLMFQGYLQGFQYWLALTVGCLGLQALNGLTGGEWGKAFRPYLRSGANTLFLIAVLLLPLIIGMGHLYPWTHAEEVAHSHLLQNKEAYLNVPFFLGRMVLYLAIWLFIWFLTKAENIGQGKSGFAMLLLVISASFAAMDWVMSIEPEWFSSIYGGIFLASSLVGTLSITTLMLSWAKPEMKQYLWHDFGKLLFMSVMFWAYLSFSQYIIIWSGQLPEEMIWYQHRMHHGWQWIGLAMIIGVFVLPFFLLLSRHMKKKPWILFSICAYLMLVRYVESWWLVAPAYRESPLEFSVWPLVSFLGIGALWVWVYFNSLTKQIEAWK